jgi:TIR domain
VSLLTEQSDWICADREQKLSGDLLLFLSHSGSDTEAARRLKLRIEEAPAARERGLKVWFDKDDLIAGRGWQEQLEEVIGTRATAFAVYVGSSGVMNWVEAEVRLGLSRAVSGITNGGQRFPFIPILAAGAAGSNALPGFAHQFQAVRDLENKPEEFQSSLLRYSATVRPAVFSLKRSRFLG